MAQPVPPLNYQSLRTISVSGEGTVDAVPDKATVRFAIATRNDDPEEARRLNAETSRETMNAVRDLGIEERKMQMQTLRLNPVNEYNQQTRRHEQIGFEAYRELVVEIEDLDSLPALIAQVIQKGANRLQGVQYGIQDRESLRNQALVKAVENAKDKANLMAATLDVEIGEVYQVSEQYINMPVPRLEMNQVLLQGRAMADAAPEPEAYAAGEMEIKAGVQVTFLLK